MADLDARTLEIRKDLETMRRAARLAGSDAALDWMAAEIAADEAGGYWKWESAKVPKKKKAGGVDGLV